MFKLSQRQPLRRYIFLFVFLLATYLLALSALAIPLAAPLSGRTLQVGQVAQEDIRAPRPITFQSALLTEQQREAVARAVPPVFTAPDTGVARKQLEHLRASLAFIQTVRNDSYSKSEQKLSDLAALENIRMSQELAISILALSDTQWQAVQQETIVVLEQVMRSTIRDDRLEETRRGLPALVSLSLSEEQAEIAAELAAAFVAPNSVYSEELTEDTRQRARQAVTPLTQSYQTSEIIVQRGRVLTPLDLEALQQLGLIQPPYNWKDLTSVAALVFLTLAFMYFYLRRKKALAQDLSGVLVITLLFLVFLIGARLTIPGHTLIPFVYPLAAFGMVVAVLMDIETALITLLSLSILASYGLPNALELTLYYTLSSIFAVLALGRAQRVLSFFLAGAAAAGAGAATTLAYRIPMPTTDLTGITSLAGAALLYGIASAGLAILLQFLLSQFFGITTPIQLMEISRPDHPLLQFLLRNAPGTYQHSLQVANLAEQAAERIGADALLTRVGALYHDAGKALNSVYFIENQAPNGRNPHENLEPAASAKQIIRHVRDGLDLARKYRLPKRIRDFIVEHHGTMIARYQYANALKAANGDESRVEIEQYRYPGPRPRSRETAILMLADGSEARVRAERPKDIDELRQIVRGVIDHRNSQRQLDKTSLTLHDLETLADSFTTTLRGMYHPRLEYPKLEEAPVPDPDTQRAAPLVSPPPSKAMTESDLASTPTNRTPK